MCKIAPDSVGFSIKLIMLKVVEIAQHEGLYLHMKQIARVVI